MQILKSQRGFSWFRLWRLIAAACFLGFACAVFTVDYAYATTSDYTGGPDNFGYTISDSDEDDDLIYAWEEITTTGTLITGWSNLDNGFAGPIPIGFDFKFYGTTYTELFAGTDGLLSFGRGYDYAYLNTPPQTDEPNNTIFLWNYHTTLLDYGVASAVYYQTFHTPDRLVIEYVNLYEWTGSNPSTMQVILYANGNILMQYKQLSANLGYDDFRLPGIENATGTDGLAYHSQLHSALAIRYSYPPPVLLSPSTQENFGKAGSTSTRQLRLFNHTGANDSFTLSVVGENQWPASLSLTQTPVLAESESIAVEVQVSIPLTATREAVDTVTIKATSTTNLSLEATAIITTQVTGDQIGYALLPASRQLAVIDTRAYQVLDYMDIARYLCDSPNRLAITPNGKQLYIACNSIVLVIDTNSQALLTTFPRGNSEGIAFSNDGQWVFMNEINRRWGYGRSPWPTYGAVVAKNTHTHESVTIINEMNLYLHDIVIHPAAPIAYIGAYNTILTIDTSNLTQDDSLTVHMPETPFQKLQIAPNGWWILAKTTQGLFAIHTVMPLTRTLLHTPVSDMAILHNGTAVFAVSNNSLITFDGDSFEVVGNHLLDGQPTSLAVSCNDAELWINDNNTPAIAVLAADDYQTIHTIHLPGRASQLTLCPQLTNSTNTLFAWSQTPEVRGNRGETVTSELTITNLSTQPASLNLTLAASWPVTLPVSSIEAPAQDTISIPMSITIPLEVPWYASDSIVITATDAADPDNVLTTVITATAYAPPVIAVMPNPLTNVQYVNEVVTQTLTISNTRGVTMAVTLSDGERFRTTDDNDDNVGSGSPDGDLDRLITWPDYRNPVEFTVFVSTLPSQTGNTLTISAPVPDRHSTISINGVVVGSLSTASETTLPIPANVIVQGVNRIQISVPNYVIIDWGELSVMPVDTGWMTENPTAFSIVAGSQQDVAVTFDSTGLRPGTYAGVVWAASNDPVQPRKAISTTMSVLPTANMGNVSGRVLNSLNMNAMTITLEGADTIHPSVTGDYTIWANAGIYNLTAVAAGYYPYRSSVQITGGGSIVENINLVKLTPHLFYRYPLIMKND